MHVDTTVHDEKHVDYNGKHVDYNRTWQHADWHMKTCWIHMKACWKGAECMNEWYVWMTWMRTEWMTCIWMNEMCECHECELNGWYAYEWMKCVNDMNANWMDGCNQPNKCMRAEWRNECNAMHANWMNECKRTNECKLNEWMNANWMNWMDEWLRMHAECMLKSTLCILDLQW
jgi:hypothetical protein